MPTKKIGMKVYVTEEEYADIASSARKCGLSVSSFAKRVCLGFHVPSLQQHEARRELLRVNGDMGRLGGLLKMWLLNEDEFEDSVRGLLRQLQEATKELKRIIVRSKGEL